MEHEPNSIRIHADGGSRGNPGPAAYGSIIYTPDGNVLAEEGRYIGIATNNQAEYQGIVAALESAQAKAVDLPIVCYLDSELVVRQLNGQYRMKNEALKPLFLRAHELIRAFPHKVIVKHVARSENAEADRLVNTALDGHEYAK